LSVFDRILKKVREGLVLYTPVQEKEFKVKSVEPERIVFLAGITPIEVSKNCWNGIPNFLKGKGWVRIGAEHVVLEKLPIGTLERYLRENSVSDKSRESQGCYVAPLLEYLNIVEVYHGIPSKVRLKTSSTEK
jgi:hypothetical protein